MTNIEQFTRELMLAHDIDYKTALSRALDFYNVLENDRPEVLVKPERERVFAYLIDGSKVKL